MRDPTLVLTNGHIYLVRADGFELGEDGPEDCEIEVVAGVHPYDDKEEKEGHGEAGVEVVESFERARKMSETSIVMKTAMPIMAKWKR